MPSLERKIWNKFHVKRRDNLPYAGWYGNRNVLAEFLGEEGFNNGAEIGVHKGRYSEILCKANSNINLLCVDPWSAWRRKLTIERQEQYLAIAKERLKDHNVTFVRKDSMDAVRDIEDNSLDFVYIDGRHEFDYVMMDIICWSQKVRPGGIVSGHDFIHCYGEGVIVAAEAYVKAHNIQSWYLTERAKDVACIPSFFWVKK